ncbi:MAG: DEAD/DEAH box helicase [Thermodesulfobacteriota bacterium]
MSEISEYLRALKSSPLLGGQVVYHRLISEEKPVYGKLEKPWPPPLTQVISALGIQDLYSHQVHAIDLIRSNKSVVVATPTASGKTLIYTLPIIEKILENPKTKALYLFPLKALAQDQLRVFQEAVSYLEGLLPTATVYDGDTAGHRRKKIREHPPNIILTNPEMLHLSILPYHHLWSSFLSNLHMVVVDEVHTYRGVMGSHMAHVFRRLNRICAYYNTRPTYLFSSATISNPAGLSEQLTQIGVESITESGAGRGKRHLLFINPIEGPAQNAILLLKAAVSRGLRTIVYTQSRKLTELIALWATTKAGPLSHRISAYRSGFLPEERRDIEKRLSSGELLAVVTTSALELGIDIGDLDLCILVGYPGSVIATWQRGGRVGRSGQESALVLIAGEDALDQYFMRNPDDFINREPEAAVINPGNPMIVSKHLVCAAAELPLKEGEAYVSEKGVPAGLEKLEKNGELMRSEDGRIWYSKKKAPHREVDLRGTGDRYQIVSGDSKEMIGEIDGFRAFKETHPGAVYLHRGETYLVADLDIGTRKIRADKSKLDYYTRVRGSKSTEILEIEKRKSLWRTQLFFGRLKVTDQVVGYEKWRIHAGRLLGVIPLELPPLIFETEGIWFLIPPEIQNKTEANYLHFMGGIHAIEHACIGIFPLLVMTDRNDLGGISTPFHPQVNGPAVFIYDGIPGGAGLCRESFSKAEGLIEYTLKTILSCPCESGCPSCVHSPKCGSGNRPIDKAAAIYILNAIKSPDIASAGIISPVISKKTSPEPAPVVFGRGIHFGVLDLETQLSADDVGGWHRKDLMKISCAVLYDSGKDLFSEFLEDEIHLLLEQLKGFELVVGFNIKNFDYGVLAAYTDFDFKKLRTLDILEEIKNRLGYRLSLQHLAEVTLGKKKSADGLQALQWWKEGRIKEILEYCKMDVEITRDLFLYGIRSGYLLFRNKSGKTVRIPVDWRISPDPDRE